jgi:hypothetical protein
MSGDLIGMPNSKALRVSEKTFLPLFINKFKGTEPFWQREKQILTFCLLPPGGRKVVPAS